MTDKKISALTTATALAGTEVLPIVQGGATVQATITQILTPAAAKGINFTANAPAAGMTSQLLNWYEEGTWTPTDQSGGGLSFTVSDNRYIRIGKQVTCMSLITYPTTADLNSALLGGLPFVMGSYASGLANLFTVAVGTVTSVPATDTMYVRGATGATVTNATLSTKTISIVITYFI